MRKSNRTAHSRHRRDVVCSMAWRCGTRFTGQLHTGQRLSYEDAWREYRLHALWALTALVISAGASSDYFAEGPARLTISRAAAAVERVDARGALLDLID